jgi:hypothetical protein
MPRVPSLENIFGNLKTRLNDYLGRNDIIVAPGVPITDLLVSLPLTEIRRVYLLIEFLHRTSTLEGIRHLLSDVDFMNEFSSEFGLDRDGFYSLVERELSRRAWPFKRSAGTPAYVVLKIMVDTNTNITISRDSLLAVIRGKDYYPVITAGDSAEFTPFEENKNYYINVPFRSIETGIKLSDFLSGGLSSTSVQLNYVSPDLPISNKIATVVHFRDGSPGETLEDFVDRLRSFYYVSGGFSLDLYLRSLLSDFGVEDFRVVYKGDPYFSPRPFGVDVWVKVPYVSVTLTYYPSNNSDGWLGPSPDSKWSPSGYSSPRNYPFKNSVFDPDTTQGKCNPIIPSLQAYISNNSLLAVFPKNYVLIRKAEPIYVKEIKLSGLNLYPSYSVDDVINDLKVSLKNYLKTRKIGERVTSSDILRIVLEHPGVDDCSNAYFTQFATSPDGNTSGSFPTRTEILSPDKVSEYVDCVDELEITRW